MPFAAATEPDVTAARLAACSLLAAAVHSDGSVVRDVLLPNVLDSDLDYPHSEVLAAIRAAVATSVDSFGPGAVLDAVLRGGSRPEVRKALVDAAATSGPGSAALSQLGATVVSLAYRRRGESLGHALVTVARDGAEADLGAMVDSAVSAIKATEARLLALRGVTP